MSVPRPNSASVVDHPRELPANPALDPLALRPPDLLSATDWSCVIRTLGLSPREEDVPRIAMYDDSIVMIARRLQLSEHTVSTYRERLFKKLGAHNLCQVVSIFFAAYLVRKTDLDASGGS
jgi:DNA-binding CsgD family transcriptional regulator